MAATRGKASTRRQQRPEKPPQGDGIHWPGIEAQRALQARLGAAESAAAAQRAQRLIEHGHGALADWLNHPGQHPGEPPPAAPGRTGRDQLDQLSRLFDAA